MTTPEMRYFSDGVDPAYPLELRIASDGTAKLMRLTNTDTPSDLTVGIFNGQLNAPQLTKLASAMSSQAFLDLENPDSVLPGVAVRELSIRPHNQDEVTKWVSSEEPTPPAFHTAEQAALATIRAVRQFPVHAVMMATLALPKEHKRDKPLRIVVEVKNIGTQSTQLLHPKNWTEEAGELLLIGLRSDIPEEELEDFHQKIEELGADKLINVQRTRPNDLELKLIPGEIAAMVFETTIDWPPGAYDVNLSLTWPLSDERGRELLTVMQVTDTFPLTITGLSKPGDNDDEDDDGLDDEDNGFGEDETFSKDS